MREIKFRAWARDHDGEMIMAPWSLDFFSDMSLVTGYGGEFPSDREDVTLMQYTGIKDRDGKEIYEGDILDLGNGRRLEVQYGAWNCGCCDDVYGYSFELFARTGITEDNVVCWEVIGNIYENPDLLKEER